VAVSDRLFASLGANELLMTLRGRFSLEESAKAHAALEARAAGPFVLDCQPQANPSLTLIVQAIS
jgi:NADPH2:quinone reductase